MEFDRIIQNGTVYDGSGKPAYRADVGVRGKTIAAIGDLSLAHAACVTDASGKAVTPGFLDMHRHADTAIFREGFGKAELMQGLTAIMNGNCGVSIVPVGGRFREASLSYLRPITGVPGDIPTASLSSYREAQKRRPMPIHAGMLAGLGTIRTHAAGFSPVLPEDGLTAIRTGLEQMLEEGARGVSLGLGYAPECFFGTEELIRALAPIRNSNTVLSAHMRSEAMNLLDSIDEVVRVAKALNVPLQISHLKATGKAQWGSLIHRALDRIRLAREDGVDVMCDAYPYTAGSTQLMHVLPPEFLEGGTEAIAKRLADPVLLDRLKARLASGRDFDNYAMLIGWENIRISSVRLEEDRQYLGRTVAEAAADTEPWRFAADLLARENCAVTMIDRLTDENDIAAIYREPFSYVISDATYPTEGDYHPRVYGAFVHVLERFVNELHALSLEEAIRKMTRLPADRYGLNKKGRIEAGADADVLVFDPNAIREHAAYDDPQQCCTGIETVLVNGVAAVENGETTGACGGTVM